MGSNRYWQISIRSLHIDKLDIYVHLLSEKKLEPDHIKPNYRADALDSKLCYSKFSPAVMILGSRQSPTSDQDLNKG